MHDAVIDYVTAQLERFFIPTDGDTLDIGGRNVNGTTAHLFTGRYVTVDIVEHDNVDIVADAATLDLPDRFDVVVSTECLEHAEHADLIVNTAFKHLRPGGWFLATMAGPGRAPHGAGGQPSPLPGEWYRNIELGDLDGWLRAAGFAAWSVDQFGLDVRCWARKDGGDRR